MGEFIGKLFGRHEESDGALVQRFAREQDGEAFSSIVGRYGDMVYSTCYRILREEAQASDAVQETFLQLARNASRIQGSVGGWLHRVATRRAVDLVRQNASRRHREQSYALDTETGASTWSEVESAVDTALDELPDDLRELLVLHFLQGRSTVRIAADHGLSQPTVSRRISEALELMRDTLRGQGIQVAAAPLQTLLLHSSRVVPQAVRAGLGKIALAKAVVAHTSALAPGAVTSALVAKAAAVAVAVTVAAGATWVASHELRHTPPPPVTPAVARQEPGAAAYGVVPEPPPSDTAKPPAAALPGAQPIVAFNPGRPGLLPHPAKTLPRAKPTQPGLLAAKKTALALTNASPATSTPPAGEAFPGAGFYETAASRQATTNPPAALASEEALLPNPRSRGADIPWLNATGTNGFGAARNPSTSSWNNSRETTSYNSSGPLFLNPYNAATAPSSLPSGWYEMRAPPAALAPTLPTRPAAPNRPRDRPGNSGP